MARIALAFVLLALVAGGLWLAWGREEPVVAGAAHVVDGDTIRIAGRAIRLKGLDAPEMRQSCTRAGQPILCGEEARAALVARIAARIVTCRVEGRDRYRRALAVCAAGGEDLGAWLVAEGLAVGYAGGYAWEEARARIAGRGLWSGTFQRPAEWRRERRPR